jgi:hypothetical protein
MTPRKLQRNAVLLLESVLTSSPYYWFLLPPCFLATDWITWQSFNITVQFIATATIRPASQVQVGLFSFCGSSNDALGVWTTWRRMVGWLIYMEGNGRDLIQGTILAFAWRTQENLERLYSRQSVPGRDSNRTHVQTVTTVPSCLCRINQSALWSTELLSNSVEKLLVSPLVRRHPVWMEREGSLT